MNLRDFVEKYGQPYSKLLGIRLNNNDDKEICKWFLAAVLYSKPIRESSATNTFRYFELNEVLTPKAIVETGWDGLVEILDDGGYTRYDFSTATKLLKVFSNLQKNYGGSLTKLYNLSRDSLDLEERLKSLGKGIGDTTVSIFLRDMQMIWPKAKPKPSPLVKMAMEKLRISDLNKISKSNKINIVELETALLRMAKDFLKKGKEIRVKID